MLGKVDKQVDDFGRKAARIEKRGKKLSKVFLWWVHPTCIRKKLVLFYLLYSFLEGQRIVKI